MAREDLMDRARELAERGRYTAAPNPLVGAVVARDDEPVGEGWHARTGGAHAEVNALRGSGAHAEGTTMYVTLEPCNHHGRTPPCTDAIVRAGISRVVVGHLDPDPRMRGHSLRVLQDAGIETEVRDDPRVERQNEQFFAAMRNGRPFVHLKLAATLDGRIAAANGDSKWVTGEAARRRAHELRAEAGAVLVGAGTMRADDPTLTARDLPEEPPRIFRVVLDPNLTISVRSRLARTAREAPVLVFTKKGSDGAEARELERSGVEVIPAEEAGGGLDLGFVLEELGRRGIRGVLVEGGGDTAGRFLEEGLVDKVTLFYAPKIMGSEGVPMIGKLRLSRMADALRFRVSGVEQLGDDLAVTLYPRKTVEE
ncbi:MAG: bifunctional diaminohydroxyphosphoribosylaminopyrimidine deaminase/5-amino-6-(5-phosphoribosylamino)uracil reductase RibD [Actinomycetota bacterium]|nr:bifunctional diaminohydroxyphosphoribosylaminopyrimidine deaminase/5-amino-6-(5-phosphoribosylamino)uracil reductase RibD [Actinomycetota bacterium]